MVDIAAHADHEEVLNIDFNHLILIVKAINASKTIEEAAKRLGMPERTLYILLKEYRIKKGKSAIVELKNTTDGK